MNPTKLFQGDGMFTERKKLASEQTQTSLE